MYYISIASFVQENSWRFKKGGKGQQKKIHKLWLRSFNNEEKINWDYMSA